MDADLQAKIDQFREENDPEALDLQYTAMGFNQHLRDVLYKMNKELVEYSDEEILEYVKREAS